MFPKAVLQADGIVPPPKQSDHGRRAPALNFHGVLDLTIEDEDASRQSKVGFF